MGISFTHKTVLLVSLLIPALANAATLNATPSNLGAVFGSAQGGDTILLSSGTYPTFSGGSKSGTVALRPASGAAVNMDVNYNPASNIAIDGVTLRGTHIMGASRNLSFLNCEMTGQVTVRDATGPMNLLFDRCHWGAIDSTGYFEGRLSTIGSIQGSCGITVQNCKFGPGGNLDGIQTGADGLKILNNEFVGIKSGGSGIHTDAIQLYGSRNTVIRGNWIHDCDSGIMAPDGTDHETVEDNIIDINYWYPIMMGSDKYSVIRHNTLRPHLFSTNQWAGVMIFGAKTGMPIQLGTIVTDNIVYSAEIENGGSRATVNDYNLVMSGVLGPHSIKGSATFVGGAAPTSWAGYRLAAGSLGKGTASDGTDMGARTFGPGVQPPPPVGDTVAPSVAIIAPATGATVSGSVNVSANASDNVGVVGVQFKLDGANLGAEDTTAPYSVTWNTVGAAGTHTLTAVARDAAGNSATSANVSVTINPGTPTPSQTLFTSQSPALLHNSDGAGVNYELGMRFISSAAGQIAAIRFWKDSSESGTHTGRLWSAGGTLLASVVFANETASGWQQQALASPVSIAANTEYLVSVNTGNTFYVATNNGLAARITNDALSSIVGSNGRYGAPGQFPTNTWQASNYFRDVVFIPAGAGGPTQIPQGGFETPAIGSGNYLYNATGAAWTFQGTSGLTANASGFTSSNPNAPEGAQVAFVQGTGVVRQNVAFAAGTYTLGFKAAQRLNWQASLQTLRITIDGVSIGDYRPSDGSYQIFTSKTFTVTAGTHVVRILGLNPNGGDNTAFVDQVALFQTMPSGNG